MIFVCVYSCISFLPQSLISTLPICTKNRLILIVFIGCKQSTCLIRIVYFFTAIPLFTSSSPPILPSSSFRFLFIHHFLVLLHLMMYLPQILFLYIKYIFSSEIELFDADFIFIFFPFFFSKIVSFSIFPAFFYIHMYGKVCIFQGYLQISSNIFYFPSIYLLNQKWPIRSIKFINISDLIISFLLKYTYRVVFKHEESYLLVGW